MVGKLAARRGVAFFNEINDPICPTEVNSPIEIIGGNPCLSNAELPPSNENPGALAGASGAKSIEQAFKEEGYRKPGPSAMSQFAKDGHKRVCRMLGYALTLNDPITWQQTSAVLAHRLTSMELASVAFAALSALEPDTREAVFEAAQWGVA